MDASEQIRKLEEFFAEYHKAEILEKARVGEEFLIIDFNNLSAFDPQLADYLLDNPEDSVKAAELALESIDDSINLKARFKNIPSTQKILIRDIRSKHIGKLLWIDGLVRQKSDVRPQVISARFECPSCGNVISVLQLEDTFKEPSKCGCGRKGKFKLLHKELVDAQRLTLEEAPESLEGGEQPKRMGIFLRDDLVSPITDRKTNPGAKILVVGTAKEIPKPTRTGGTSTTFDLMIEANYVEPMEEDYSDIIISDDEMKEIIELSQHSGVYKKIIDSMAPTVYGHDKVKEALLLQMLGGVRKSRDDGITTRGDIHVLLVGDPGAGKSQLLKRAHFIAPKSRYVSGKGASGAGLTAAVVRDEFLGGWSLEAGALVLANKGICMIDELDKMSPDDRNAMHEALEQQTISISKANIQATLRAETTVLAAANPKFGRFDPYELLAKQIDLPSTLINRFDLIFPIRDLPDKETDAKMGAFILNLHQQGSMTEQELETKFLRKYMAYAKQTCTPNLTDSAEAEILDYYVKMRASGSEEGGVSTIPISARQLEGLIRLSEASAKVRLSEKVTRKDARRAIDLTHYCLTQIGLDPETGKIDIDRISTGITASERSKIINVREIINELEDRIGKTIPVDDIIAYAVEKGLDEEKVYEAIEKLKRSGDIFEPKRGFIQKI
ncbi:minichromosome maintenance protein MCM [Candidatus Woesearchaeota archaeon]|nr:minichromosome maintenance protein MCM [Candidatus Woesearchaeota archaeon]